MITICSIWNSTNVLWKDANWTWDECRLVDEIIAGNLPGVDATTLIQPWLIEPWNPYQTGSLDKRRRLIKLLCKVRGEKYEAEKSIKDFNVTVDDIKMIVKAVSNVDLNFKLEE